MSDLTPEALDELERLHAAATPAHKWDRDWDDRPYPCDGYPWSTCAIGPQHGIPKERGSEEDRKAFDRAVAACNADVAVIHALVNAAPALIAAAREAAALRARLETTERERDAARHALAECYILSGADPDGNDPDTGAIHLWPTAVDEVRTLRSNYDEACADAVILTKERDEARAALADARADANRDVAAQAALRAAPGDISAEAEAQMTDAMFGRRRA